MPKNWPHFFASEETLGHLLISWYPCRIKVKVKLALCLIKGQAMKTYWGSEGIAPCILDLGTRWRWVVSLTPWQKAWAICLYHGIHVRWF